MLGAARERAICFHENEAVPPEWRTFDFELTVRSSFTINLYPPQHGAWMLLYVPLSMKGWRQGTVSCISAVSGVFMESERQGTLWCISALNDL